VRKFIDIVSKELLTEAKGDRSKPADLADPTTRSKFSLMPDLEMGGKSVATAGRAKSSVSLPGKKAGKSKTRSRASAMGMGGAASHPGMGDFYSQLNARDAQDDISDDEARRFADMPDDEYGDETNLEIGSDTPRQLAIGSDRPEPTNDNLPAIVNKDIALSGDTKLQPEWHQVKHLPGYMQNAIRKLGREVFSQFTDTPIEDIQLIANLPGMNPERDVKGVMNWIRQNGVPEDEVEMTFPGNITAHVRLWKTEEFSFLLVKDFMGIYIYAWAGGRGVHIGNKKPKLIGR